MSGERKPMQPGLSPIVQTVARWLKGFVLLYGIYVVAYGHVTPGGGFAGGVIIACGFVMLTLAGGGGLGLGHFSRGAASTLDAVGVLLFLVVAWLGMAAASGTFFANFIDTAAEWRFTLMSAGIIPIANGALGLKVASSLFLVFTVLAALRLARRRGEEGEEEDDR